MIMKDKKLEVESVKNEENGFSYDIFLAARLREQVLAFMFQLLKLIVGIC